MIDTLIRYDQQITRAIFTFFPHFPLLDSLFSFFSIRGLTIIIWIVLFFLFWYQERKDKTYHHFLLAFATSFGATFILINIFLKNLFLRTRPWIENGIIPNGCPMDYSFPSGHASGAFAGAVIFAYFDPKRRLFYYGIALIISFSRLYLGCHYLLDVIFGALIGYFIGIMTIRLMTNRKIL